MKNNKCAVELHTGEKFVGFLVEPNSDDFLLLNTLSNGIFLKRDKVVSYFSDETIKEIRLAENDEKEC